MLPVLTLTLLKQNLTLIKRIFFRRHFKFSLKLIQTGLFYCRSWLVRIFDKFYSAVWNLSSWGWSNDSVVMGTCCSSRRPGGLVPPVPRGLTPSSDLWGHCTHMVPRHRWRQNPHTHKAIIKKKFKFSWKAVTSHKALVYTTYTQPQSSVLLWKQAHSIIAFTPCAVLAFRINYCWHSDLPSSIQELDSTGVHLKTIQEHKNTVHWVTTNHCPGNWPIIFVNPHPALLVLVSWWGHRTTGWLTSSEVNQQSQW